jgi:hypothetical protein
MLTGSHPLSLGPQLPAVADALLEVLLPTALALFKVLRRCPTSAKCCFISVARTRSINSFRIVRRVALQRNAHDLKGCRTSQLIEPRQDAQNSPGMQSKAISFRAYLKQSNRTSILSDKALITQQELVLSKSIIELPSTRGWQFPHCRSNPNACT